MRPRITPAEEQPADAILSVVEGFLAAHPGSLLLESGETLFDLRESRYKLEQTQGRVVFHLWSEQRNMVRRILAAATRGPVLRLTAQRFGQREPQSLELVAEHGRRLPLGRDRARQHFIAVLRRVLAAHFPEDRTEALRSAMDLEHSFGPAYLRGLQTQGQHAWAVIAVSPEETPSTIDGILTIGILWLAHCRERADGRRLVQGLRVIVPKGSAATTLSRMAWLDTRVARYQLLEFDPATETLAQQDPADRGNLATRLVRAPNDQAATGPESRFAEAIPKVLSLLPAPAQETAEDSNPAAAHRSFRWLYRSDPGFEMRLRSSAELTFLRHGMEFARIRCGYAGSGFNRALEVTVGAGPNETVLTERNAETLRELVHELFRRRTAQPEVELSAAPRRDPLFRLQPERWLESLLRSDLPSLDAALQTAPVYVQVPAITGANDRGMLDLLAVTHDARLAVIEVKAEEDLQLAMQGLDYWIRVRDHHIASIDAATGLGDLQRHGYFPQLRLSPEPPLLLLVAPALRIHPATEVVLRHLDPRVRWTLIALDERWRSRIRPVWKRRASDRGALVG